MAIFLLAACATTPREFEVREIAGTFEFASPFYWIDNRRLVISALAPGSSRLDGQRTLASHVLNVDSGEVSRLPSGGHPGCFFRGYRAYIQEDNGYVVTYAGSFGNETEVRRQSASLPRHMHSRLNRYDCRPMDGPNLFAVVTEERSRLASNDGYLGFLSQDGGRPRYVFYKGDSPVPQLLPFFLGGIDHIDYGRFGGVYIFSSRPGTRPLERAETAKVWTLHPDGQLDEIELPKGPTTHAAMLFSNTAAGLVMASSAVGGFGDVGDAGLYLVNPKKLIRIVAGYPDWEHFSEEKGIPVSPDGCRFAMSLSSLPPPKRRALFLLDVCRS